MIAQALPKTNELVDEINSLVIKSRRPTDWQIKLLIKKANALKGKVADHTYFDMLGRIYGLANDSQNLIQSYEKALKLAPTDQQTQFHFLFSLHNIGFYSEELNHGKKLLMQFPEDVFLPFVIQSAMDSGRFQEAFDFLNKLEEPYKHHNYQNITDGLKILKESQLHDEVVVDLQQLAFSIIPKMNLYFSGANINIARNCIHYEIFVDLPVEAIFDVNWELAGAFAEKTGNKYNDVLMFSYSSVDVLDERWAA
jgi:tetratricopeptide (TPR) repeat protein